MPATDSDLKYYLGANPTPTNDTDPYGGAIDTSPELNELTAGILIATVPRPTSGSQYYYGIAYRKNEHASSDWDSAAFTNRAGAKLNTSGGIVSVVSDNSADTGTLRVAGQISAAWDTESITLTGTTTAYGAETWDASQVWRYEYLVGGAAAVPTGNLTIAVDGEVVAVIYGSGGGYGNNMASAEWDLAVASSKGATISGTNRITAPAAGISAFSKACKWGGSGAVDQSIAVPGGSLDFGEYIGYCIRLTAHAGIAAPVSGYLFPDINLIGVPS